MFQELKWLPFYEIVTFKQVSLAHEAVTDSAPQYIQTLLTNIKDHSKYPLRSSTNYSFLEHITNHFPIQA